MDTLRYRISLRAFNLAIFWFFEDSPKVVRRPHKSFANIFRKFRRLPKIFEDTCRLPKTSNEDSKMFRSYTNKFTPSKLPQFCTSAISQDFSQGWKYFHSVRRSHLPHLRSLLDSKDDFCSCGNVSHNNSPFQLYSHPDYRKIRTTDTAGSKSVTVVGQVWKTQKLDTSLSR